MDSSRSHAFYRITMFCQEPIPPNGTVVDACIYGVLHRRAWYLPIMGPCGTHTQGEPPPNHETPLQQWVAAVGPPSPLHNPLHAPA